MPNQNARNVLWDMFNRMYIELEVMNNRPPEAVDATADEQEEALCR